MAGRVQWEAQVDSNVAKLLSETKELRDQLDGIKKGNYEIKLNIDDKKLEKVISNLDKMLNSLGKGTGDFKEFENLSKQLNEIVSEVKELNKAFSGINDSGVSNLLSSIQSIDKSLSSLSEHITNVNKDFGSVGKNASDNVGQINEARKATEGLTEATKELANAQKNVGNKSNISSGIKDTFQGDISNTSAVEQQNKLQEELHETQEEAKKARDIISQVGLRQTYITHEPDDNGNMVEHERGQYSFIERLQDGQLRNVLVTYDENTQKWTEDTLSLSTAFEKVGKEIISLDNKINQYKNARSKTLESHPTYDFSADDALITQTEKRRQILLDTLALYDREGEYQYEIVEFEKRRAENAERLKNITKKQENLSDAKQGEKFQKDFNKAYEEAVRINKALNETKSKVDGLSKHSALSTQFAEVETTISSLNKKLAQGELTVFEYNKAVKETVDNYSKLVGIQQRRDVEVYNADAKRAEELQRQADAEVAYYKKRDEEYERLRAQYKAEGKAQEDAYNAQVLKEQAEAWEKNVKAIQEYMDANTKLNTLMAKDKGTGKHASDITRQEKEVEKLKESAIEARVALSSMVNPHEAPIDDWGKWVEAMEKFEQATKGSAESVAKLEDALRSARNAQLSSIDSTINNGQSKYEDFNARKAQSDAYKNSLKELGETLERLRTLRASLSNTRAFTDEEQAQIQDLTKSVREYVKEIGRMSADEKGSNDISRFKLLDRIAEYMKKNTRMSREFKAELESLMDTLRTGGANVQTGDILTQFEKIKDRIRQAKQEGISFFDIFKNKAVYGFAARLAQYYLSFYDFIRYARYAVNAVRDIDTALTELRKVSDATEQRLTQNIKNSTATAKELGAAISDVVSATADWAKMGYNVDDAEELARVSVLYKNVGDGIEIDDANSSLISTLQGFQLDASEAEGIIDKFNEVANNYAIDSAGIGEALKRSAASFNAANTDLSKSIALITATRLQNWLNIWKHILRIYLIAIEVFITMHHNIEETTI